MELPCITLCTKEKGCFAWQNGYTDVSASELEALLKIGREIVCSLEAEVEARQLVIKLEQSSAVSECAEKLRKSAGNLKILERLDEKEAKLVASAVSVLKVEQTSRDAKLYQTFLRDVYYQCSRSLALLCAASLGKQRIISLNARDRIGLFQYLKRNQETFTSPALDSLAGKHQIPDEPGMFSLNLTVPMYHCS
ncbi:hypothetical protein GQ44DRAFT_613312 [Phaeosphaeriaceae sp. PMI808]|nr:hypothetical protein GQ44DRAFT_613312 [Phaeosphaeriaceae sp. PMI808]